MREPKFYKNTRTWEFRCREAGCNFSVHSPSETEARGNVTLHLERSHAGTTS